MIQIQLKSLLVLALLGSLTTKAMDTQPTEAEAVVALTELVRFMKKHTNPVYSAEAPIYSNEEMAQVEKTIATHKEHINTLIQGETCLLHAAVSGQPFIVRQLLFHGADVHLTFRTQLPLNQNTHALGICRAEDIESFTAILQADENAQQTVNTIMRVHPYGPAYGYPLHGIIIHLDGLGGRNNPPDTDRMRNILKHKLCWLMLYGADPRLTYSVGSGAHPRDLGKNMFDFAQELANKQDKKDVKAILNQKMTNEKSYYRNFMIEIGHNGVPQRQKRDDRCVIS